MIIIEDDVLTSISCEDLIRFFEKNKKQSEIWRDTFTLNIQQIDNTLSNRLGYLFSSFLNLKGMCVFPETIQIVKWPTESFQDLHFDVSREETVYTSITYLNDNFEGGKTYFEEDLSVKPKIGRGFFFDGKKYKHGVSKINSGIRYTLALWYTNNLNYSI